MTKSILTLILICLVRTVIGQTNLVPNWSFEIHTACPWTQSQLHLATPWFSGPSTDLYDSCCTSSGCKIPFGGAPYDTAYPKHGRALIGMHQYYNEREYAQVKLIDTLKNNFCYYVEFFTRRGPMCDWAINNIAATFSSTPFSGTELPSNPIHITRYNNPIIRDTNNWVQVAGIYNATGGEVYLTLGNMKPDTNTTAEIVYNNSIGCSYYLFDAVKVYSINPSGSLPWQYHDTTVTLGDSIYIGNHIGGNFNSSWFTHLGTFIASGAGMFVKPSSSTKYVVQYQICGITRSDTIEVTVNVTTATNRNNCTEFKIKSGPNPTDGIVTLQVINTNTDNLEFRISNVFNEVVKTFSAPSETVIFDISDYDIGIYYLHLIRNGQILQTKKIIKR